MTRLVKLFLCMLFPYVASAQNDSTVNSFSEGLAWTPYRSNTKFLGLRFFTENDFITPIGQNRDANYTGGVSAEILTNLLPSNNWFLNPLGGRNISQSFYAGITAFTPEKLNDSNIVYGDRPYSSFSYIGFGYMSVNKAANMKMSNKIVVGSLGQRFAGDAQTTIHRDGWFGSTRPEPLGWHRQIADGGAFAFGISSRLENRIFQTKEMKLCSGKQSFRWLIMSLRNEVYLGSYMIYTMHDPRFYLFNMNFDFAGNEDEPATLDRAPAFLNKRNKIRKARPVYFHAYISPRVRAILHNSNLTGQLIDAKSAYTISYTDMKKLLGEYELGLGFRWHFIRLGYSMIGRTKEFTGDVDMHNWGGVYLGAVFQLD